MTEVNVYFPCLYSYSLCSTKTKTSLKDEISSTEYLVDYKLTVSHVHTLVLALHSIRTTDPEAFTKRNVQTKNKTKQKKLAEIEANLHAKNTTLFVQLFTSCYYIFCNWVEVHQKCTKGFEYFHIRTSSVNCAHFPSPFENEEILDFVVLFLEKLISMLALVSFNILILPK